MVELVVVILANAPQLVSSSGEDVFTNELCETEMRTVVFQYLDENNWTDSTETKLESLSRYRHQRLLARTRPARVVMDDGDYYTRPRRRRPAGRADGRADAFDDKQTTARETSK